MTVVDAISAAGGPISLEIADLSAVRIVSGNDVKVGQLGGSVSRRQLTDLSS
jgi:hypothetical protein